MKSRISADDRPDDTGRVEVAGSGVAACALPEEAAPAGRRTALHGWCTGICQGAAGRQPPQDQAAHALLDCPSGSASSTNPSLLNEVQIERKPHVFSQILQGDLDQARHHKRSCSPVSTLADSPRQAPHNLPACHLHGSGNGITLTCVALARTRTTRPIKLIHQHPRLPRLGRSRHLRIWARTHLHHVGHLGRSGSTLLRSSKRSASSNGSARTTPDSLLITGTAVWITLSDHIALRRTFHVPCTPTPGAARPRVVHGLA